MTVQPNREAFALPRRWQQLVDLGFSVFPIPKGRKEAAIKWKPYQSAQADLETIRQWASHESNIGIVTGAVSGLIVLDLDSDDAVEETGDNRYRDAARRLLGKRLGRPERDDAAALEYAKKLLDAGLVRSSHEACMRAAVLFSGNQQMSTVLERLRKKFREKYCSQ